MPGFGALGLIRLAAVSESSYLQENQVVPTVHRREAASTPITSVQSVVLTSGRCIYIILYAYQITSGNTYVPIRYPPAHPTTAAVPE